MWKWNRLKIFSYRSTLWKCSVIGLNIRTILCFDFIFRDEDSVSFQLLLQTFFISQELVENISNNPLNNITVTSTTKHWDHCTDLYFMVTGNWGYSPLVSALQLCSWGSMSITITSRGKYRVATRALHSGSANLESESWQVIRFLTVFTAFMCRLGFLKVSVKVNCAKCVQQGSIQ